MGNSAQDITWIGWRWQISAGVVSIPHAKMKKLQDLIHKLHGCEKTSKKYVEQCLGLAIGITQLFPSMRTWLHGTWQWIAYPIRLYSRNVLQVLPFLSGVAWFRCVINMFPISVTLADALSRTNAFSLEFVIQLPPNEDCQFLPWELLTFSGNGFLTFRLPFRFGQSCVGLAYV